jgi:hypothetical protein
MSDRQDPTAARRHEAVLVSLAKLEASLRDLGRLARVHGDVHRRQQKHVAEAYHAGMADAYYSAAQHAAEAYRTAVLAIGRPGDTFSNQT